MGLARGRWGAARRDEGSTQVLMLMGTVCALALTVMIVPLAQAGDMRTRGQTGADAAAIAALTPLRDQAVQLAQMGVAPTGLGLWEVVSDTGADGAAHTAAARRYADRNGTRLVGDVEVTGTLGHTMKASVATKDCQIKPADELTAAEREDLRERRGLCTDASGAEGVPLAQGAGTAVARLRMPDCDYDYSSPDDDGAVHPIRLDCGGVTVWATGSTVPRSAIVNVFKIRLVAEEDSARYTGMPPMTGNFGALNWDGVIPGNPCEKAKEIIANAQAKIGKRYVWGGESEAEGGYDCSGLIYASYLEAGISIPRTTFGQWPYGVRVAGGQERPGDLVFFNSGPGSGTGRPGHVGLVIDPARKLMIEAACTNCGPIRVSSYDRSNLTGFTRPLAHAENYCEDA